MRRVHREATEYVVFIGSQPAWTEQSMEARPRVPQNGENALCSTGHGRNGILFIWTGLAYRKTEETDFSWTFYSGIGVLLIGRSVAYRKTDLLRSKRGSH